MNDKVTISTYQFMKMFPNEEAARVYLENRRWKGRVCCPFCNQSDQIEVRKRIGFYRCPACDNDFTVRTGTIFERSHIPLDKWIFAMYLLVTARKGISSLQLSKELSITQKSAWFMLQRLREACKNDDILLRGIVEAAETFIGGKEGNKHSSKKLHIGRGQMGKTGVLGMRERNGKTKSVIIAGTDTNTIQAAVRENVAPGAILCTDEAISYRGMNEYPHLMVNHSAKQYVNGMAHTQGMESVWAVLKRGYYGIYHNFSTKHLRRYLGEFSFRLSEGQCKIPSIDRINSLFDKAIGKTLTYKKLKGVLEEGI